MIRSVGADRESFKTMTFGPGLNVILADKSRDSSDRQSRNGAGKTSFVELLHFLFGADAKPGGIFRSDALRDWTFTAAVDVGGRECSVSRSGQKPSRIDVAGDFGDWPAASAGDTPLFREEEAPPVALRRRAILNEEWKGALGAAWFGLPVGRGGTERFHPTFRSLFSFVARRQESGGFLNPMQHSTMQQVWDRQVTVCYLLGLDWSIPVHFQELRDREKVRKELRKAAQTGELGPYIGNTAELRTRLAVAENRADGLRERLESFQVVPQYKELEVEASRITGEIDNLNIENVVDHDLIRELQESLTMERAPDTQDLAKVYAEVGIVLPGLARRRIAEVERFHRTIIENRRTHLGAEIESAQERVAERDRRKVRLDDRRSQVMGLLKAGGALDHYTGLREELGRAEADVEMLKQKLATAERLDRTQTELALDRTRLVKALQDDIRERDDILREVIVSFEALSRSLYELAGSLVISDTPNGPRFEAHIEAERSKGITNMQIFCFDLMLMEICGRRGRWPGFLIHDSHLFDGVDERQVAKALQVGAERAAAGGFQYIVTLNSDSLPAEGFAEGFDVRDYVVEPRLTDKTETGGLFGVRFN